MKVLIVDDDRTLADVIAFTFRREGYEVILAEDGEQAIEKWESESPDLILLDVNLPKIDGYTVCRNIRDFADTPIILLTVRGEEEDILDGFSLGADDYVTKPFSPRQLMARVRAVLRRAKKRQPVTHREWGPLSLNLNRHELTFQGGKAVQLSGLELRLLDCLMINAGQIVTADIIIEYVWSSNGGDMDMVRQLIHRLRMKLDNDPQKRVHIKNVPGIGYELIRRGLDEIM